MANRVVSRRKQTSDDEEDLVNNIEYEYEPQEEVGFRPQNSAPVQEMFQITADVVMENQTSNNDPDTQVHQRQPVNHGASTSSPAPQRPYMGHPIFRPPTSSSPGTRSQRLLNDWSNRNALQTILSTANSPERFMASQGSPYMNNLLNIVSSTDDGMHQKNIMLSRRIPKWVWYLLAKSLGIKLSPSDKPVLATFLHILTMLVAMAFSSTGLWFIVSDILSEYSKTTVMIGSVAVLLGFSWICIGIYSHKLAGRLFSNKNFVESVRMHAKTFLKISTVGLLVIIGYLIVGIFGYESFGAFTAGGAACKAAGVYPTVCTVMYATMLAFAVIGITWNMLVGCVLLSVCRTHTIGIRRFMRELAVDSHIYELNLKNEILGLNEELDARIQKHINNPCDDDWFVWDDKISTDPHSDDVTSQKIFLQSIVGAQQEAKSGMYVPRRSTSVARDSISHPPDLDDIEEQIEEMEDGDDDNDEEKKKEENQENNINSSILNENEEERETIPSFVPTNIMSNETLLFSYWKLSQRLRETSRFLQRWLSSMIAFVLIWCADYIMYWTTHSATLSDILLFLLPLVTLLIICSAYAEVNSEGQRMLKCICPTEERMTVLFFLSQQPLQMQVFSFPITYNALLGVVLAFSVAIASRIILDEVLK